MATAFGSTDRSLRFDPESFAVRLTGLALGLTGLAACTGLVVIVAFAVALVERVLIALVVVVLIAETRCATPR